MRPARGATPLSGVLAIDKPTGLTSHDVIATLRRATGERRIGHAGTLDPLATGVLVVLIGPATRLAQYLTGHDKSYEATVIFGATTDTLDSDGTVTGRAEVPETVLDADVASQLLASMEGATEQVPPVYSAIKTDGVIAHRAARAGAAPDLAPRSVIIHEARLLSIDTERDSWYVALHVSKGTYVRAFARDLGVAAGTLAHVAALRRVASGPVTISEAVSLDDAVDAASAGGLERYFLDPVRLLGMPVLEGAADAALTGRPVAADAHPGSSSSVVLADDAKLYAIYRREGDLYRAETVLPGGVCR